MNFLAHIYLSGSSLEVILGNFIADFVKGNQIQDYDPLIIKGILLHRKIDEFTDKHPVVQLTKQRLRPKFRHYSGLIADMYFDHYLVINWKLFSTENIDDYIQKIYKLLQDNRHVMPDRAKSLLYHMIQNNLLLNYGKKEGLRKSFEGMSRRTPYESRLNEATDFLFEQYNEIQQDFLIFFPQLITYSKQIAIQ